MKKFGLLIAPLTIVSVLAGCGCSPAKADSVVYGNIITMDDKDTIAEAVAVRDKKIIKVGKREEIFKLVTANTKVYDHEGSYVYPGFLDSHTHTMFAGNRAIGQANVGSVIPAKKDKYKEIIQEFIKKNPDKEKYLATGWVEGGDGADTITKDDLDDICKEKPLVLNTCSGHSALLNTKALEYFHGDDLLKEYGPNLVKVDTEGNLTGYMCENPAIKVLKGFTTTVDEAKGYILHFQNFAFENGFTGVSDAGTELMSPNALQAHVDLQKENKLKLRTYAYMMVKDNVDDPKARIDEIADYANKNNGEYFKVVGAKVFLDGVLEAGTAWTIDDYKTPPEGQTAPYHGLERFNNQEKMIQLIAEAGKKNLAVHSHSIGDGATRFFLKCIEEAQKISGNKDQRNAASHLQLVSEEDIQKFADTNTIAVTAPLWTAKTSASNIEIKYIGDEKYKTGYPIKSFIDKGAKTAFHSDYPVSPSFSVPMSIYMANYRGIPGNVIPDFGGDETVNNEAQRISRKDAVLSMTKNVAYMWHQEDNLGSIEEGKIANMSVFDGDLINGDFNLLPFTSCVATIVDGEEVYNAGTIDPEKVLAHIAELIWELFFDPKYDWDDDPEWEPEPELI